jgi:hypothetical protein
MNRYLLTRVITLRNGNQLATLADALQLIASLPASSQASLRWQLVEALVIDAMMTGRIEDIRHATEQLRRAVGVEGIK